MTQEQYDKVLRNAVALYYKTPEKFRKQCVGWAELNSIKQSLDEAIGNPVTPLTIDEVDEVWIKN